MEVFTIKEVAQKLKISRNTVTSLIDAGDLPCFNIGKRKRVSEIDLNHYIESGVNRCQYSNQVGIKLTDTTSRSTVVGFAEALKKKQSRRR